ncbi:hypothetical protein LRAMOSA01068 [Lichtheimia ramosa]|uniref:Interferon-related developmental regulator N-terminal domain-containing protein n=1 Tax=Lichtheimia ramosa TaxID=688394 RepID=A0A077W8I0_9FUNG|nr:hypothetical protein LRAMOSA01068 [Lichtheimia ramosa]
MPRNLAKKAAKQQSRIAALNALGTPASSRAASEDEDDLDVASEASFGTVDSTGLLDDSTLEDELRRSVDDLGEKRTSTRETALTKINRLLANHFCGSIFEANASRQEALLQLLVRSLRKPGTSQEAVLAARGIGLTFISEGDIEAGEIEDLFGMVLKLLKNCINTSTDPQLKCQCIETLAMVTFIAASTSDTCGGMDYFYNILVTEGECIQPDEKLSQNDMNPILYASLRAYGLLYASIYGDARGSWEDAFDESQGVMPAHLDLLQSGNKDIRVAAGENIALMFECVNVTKRMFDQDVEEEEEDEMPEYGEMDELRDMLQRLATDSNRRVNKQDRKEQKSAFRDIVRTVEDGTRPNQKLKIGGRALYFRGWAKIIELAAFRSFLGSGLARHMQASHTLSI